MAFGGYQDPGQCGARCLRCGGPAPPGATLCAACANPAAVQPYDAAPAGPSTSDFGGPQAPAPAASVNLGTQIGDYEVLRTLGSGGMGSVYQVRHSITQRIEAVKVLRPEVSGMAEVIERFFREIRLMASFDHPNIAKIHTAFWWNEMLVMVMEFIEGSTLDEELRRGPVGLAKGIDYICQTLEALEYAHARGVVHRDIKPSNLMINQAGLLKLMDFGVASAAAAQVHLTKTGGAIGTPYYMSPEQVSGIPVDARSDYYSLGVVLYQIATNRRPFDGKSEFAIMAAHVQEMPRPPIELAPELPEALNQVILRSLEKDPTRRFQTAEEFRVALRAAESAQPPTLRDRPSAPPPPPPPVPVHRSHRALYMAVGAIAAIAVLGLAAYQVPNWLRTRGATQPPPPAAISQPENAAPAQTAVTAASPPGEQSPAAGPAPGVAAGTAGSGGQQVAPPPSAPASRPASVTAQHQGAVPASPPARGGAPPRTSGSPPGASGALSQVTASSQTAGTTPGTAAASPSGSPPPAAPSPQAVREAQDRLRKLDAEASGLDGFLNGLANQLKGDGLPLRPELQASWTEMTSLRKDAATRLERGDLDGAKHSMDRLETQVRQLQKTLFHR